MTFRMSTPLGICSLARGIACLKAQYPCGFWRCPIKSVLSFPRRRESIWPLNVNLDSRFRGNDTIGILGHRQQPRGYWAYRHAMPRARLDMPNGVLIRNVIASEARRSRFSTGAEKRDYFVAKFIPKQSVGLLAMTIKFRCRQFRKSRAQWYCAEWCDNSRYIRRMGPRPVASLGLPRALRF